MQYGPLIWLSSAVLGLVWMVALTSLGWLRWGLKGGSWPVFC
jgi:hypothetical protein